MNLISVHQWWKQCKFWQYYCVFNLSNGGFPNPAPMFRGNRIRESVSHLSAANELQLNGNRGELADPSLKVQEGQLCHFCSDRAEIEWARSPTGHPALNAHGVWLVPRPQMCLCWVWDSHALVCLSSAVPLCDGEAPVGAMQWACAWTLPGTSYREAVDLILPMMTGLEAALFWVNVTLSSRQKEHCGPIIWVTSWLWEAHFWSFRAKNWQDMDSVQNVWSLQCLVLGYGSWWTLSNSQSVRLRGRGQRP